MRSADVVNWLAILVAVSCLYQGQMTRALDYQWRIGRATHYGGMHDPWSIHDGSCYHAYLDPNSNLGWSVAALADAAPDYSNSCGRCYEISCANMVIKDGYGETLDRSNVCFDEDASVVVMITDSCPCNYPPNYYSNKRWCCNDMYHFDVSIWAYEKLADPKWGVIAIKYREVPCEHCPWKPAQLPAGSGPHGSSRSPPDGWDPSKDPRPKVNPCNAGQQQSSPPPPQQQDYDQQHQQQHSSSSQTHQGSQGGEWGSFDGTSILDGGSLIQMPDLSKVFSGSLGGWKDISFKLRPWNLESSKDSNGNHMYCCTVEAYGASVFSTSGGKLSGKKTLEMIVKAVDGKTPNMDLTLQSSKGDCRTFNLASVLPMWKDQMLTYTIQLGSFSWDMSWQSAPTEFHGCSSGIGAWDVNRIQVKNNQGYEQHLCIQSLKLY